MNNVVLDPRRRTALALSTSVALAIAASAAPARADLAAFPGAQGFGGNTTGARAAAAPTIVVVNTLNDDPGGAVAGQTTLRDALSGSNRIVVFAVGGYINLNSTAISAKSNLTILGQTAPGQGVSTQGAEISFDGQHNDILQYFRGREGSLDTNEKTAYNLGNSTNMILDHVDAELAQYDNIDDVYPDAFATVNHTIQNSMIADPIKAQQFNDHEEGGSVTYLNNIWANSHNRNPLAKGDTQFVNNVVYDYQGGYTTGNSSGVFKYDIIGNYFVAGPATSSAGNAFYQLDANQSAYLVGNMLDSNKDGTLNGSNLTTADGANLLSTYYSPSTKYLPTLTAAQAFAFDMLHSGDMYNANGTWTRDELDGVIASQVASNGTLGNIYNTQTSDGASNGGFGTLSTPSLVGDPNYFDTVPVAWIAAHGIPATTAGLLTKNALGYYMIEQYAQEVGDQYGSMIASSGDYNTLTYPASSPAIYTHLLVNGTGATSGTLTISSADPAAGAFSIGIGGNGPASGETLNVTGGNLTVQDTIYVGYQNNGTLNISGGTVRTDNIQLGNTVYPGGVATSYTGNLNLTGGTLQSMNIVLGAGTPGNYTTGGSMNWSGNATLQMLSNFTINVPATLGTGGGKIDTNGFSGAFSGNIDGNGTFTKNGAGAVTLSGTNTYTGGTVLNGGEVTIVSDASIGGPTSAVTFNGGLLGITGTTITDFSTHAVNWSTFNGGFDVTNANATITINQNISGSGSFTVAGKGTLVLTGTNNYTGGTFLQGGELSIATDASIGGATSKLTFTGGVLQINGSQPNIDSHVVNWSTFSGGFDIVSATNTFTVSSAIGGTGIFTKLGAGTVVLNAANTFTGNTGILGGTLRLGNALALQNSTVNITGSGATLDVNHLNATIGGLGGNQPLDLEGTTLTLGGSNTSTTYSGNISSTGGPATLIKNGTGELTLSGNNSFGNTTINAGDIHASSSNALGTGGTVTSNVPNGIELGNGVTLPVNIVASPGTVEFLNVPDASANATLAGNVSITGSANQYRLGISGSGATLTLTGTNTTSTLTLLTTGNIVFAGNGSLTSSQAINIGRSSSGSSMHLTLQDNAFFSSVAGINLGGINGTSDDGNTTVTLNGNASLNAGTKPLNINNSDVTGTTTLTLNGTSTVYAGSLTASGSKQGLSTMNFNGGTIIATAGDATALFFPKLGTAASVANVQAGGLNVNDGGFTITIAQPLVHSGSGTDGGLDKFGNGSLTLTAANTYNGTTSLNAGNLYVNNTTGSATGTGTVLLNAGLFGGTGTVTGTLAAGSAPHTINPGIAGTSTVGTLTVGGLITNSNTTLAFDLTSPATTSDKLAITGTLNLNGGSIAINSQSTTGAASLGYYKAISYSTLTGSTASLVLPAVTNNIAYTLDTSHDANFIDIHRGYIGDANDDGAVDLNDLNIVLNNLGTATPSWTSGNFDGASTIDLNDLNAVLNNLGTSIPAAAIADAQALLAAAAPAPEPASLFLLALAAPLILRRSRSR